MIDPAYTPWLDHYGSVCKHMELPDRTLYNMVAYAAKDVMDSVACEFMGRKITYREFMGSVDRCAAGLYAKGIRAGDHVMICMPNCPQAVIAFYAVNRLDAVAVMVHPLSSKGELEYVVGYADCRIIITLDMFFPNFPPLKDCGMCQEFIVSSIADGLSAAKGFMYRHVVGRKDPKVPKGTEGVTLWNYGDGFTARFSSTTCYPASSWSVRIELFGTEGAYYYTLGGPEGDHTYWWKNGRWSEKSPFAAKRRWRQASDNFAYCLRTGEALEVDWKPGRESRLVLDKLYESAEKGGIWVKIEN